LTALRRFTAVGGRDPTDGPLRVARGDETGAEYWVKQYFAEDGKEAIEKALAPSLQEGFEIAKYEASTDRSVEILIVLAATAVQFLADFNRVVETVRTAAENLGAIVDFLMGPMIPDESDSGVYPYVPYVHHHYQLLVAPAQAPPSSPPPQTAAQVGAALAAGSAGEAELRQEFKRLLEDARAQGRREGARVGAVAGLARGGWKTLAIALAAVTHLLLLGVLIAFLLSLF
jgi:hypothetical protein